MEKIDSVDARKIDSIEARYFSLSRDCSLKRLENPSVYNRNTGELYNLDNKSMAFIYNNQNVPSEKARNSESLRYMINEGIYEPKDDPIDDRTFSLRKSPSPSLRYMLIHLTSECNLKCRHCYLGEPEKQSLPYEDVEKVLKDFQDLQGLTVLFSGGEALKYKDFWKLNEKIPEYDMSFELLSNGTLVTEEDARRLNFSKIQVSLDGMEEGHDFMRSNGSYKKAISGIENLIKAGKKVSIATMVHKKNLDEFEDMEKLLTSYGIDKWIVSAPCEAGRWEKNHEYGVDNKTATPIIKKYTRGTEGPHKSTGDYTCGTHLFVVMPDGTYSSCAVMIDSLGKINDISLEEAWKSKKRIRIDELTECKSCDVIKECKGGCRQHALVNGNIYGKDPQACEIFEKEVK